MSGLFEKLSGAEGIKTAGKSAQNIAEFNAKVKEQEAEAARQRAAFAGKRQAKRGVAIQSALEAKLGKAGGIGSPVAPDLIGEQAAELELENTLIGFEGEVAALGLESQALSERIRGSFEREKSKSAARQANVQFGLQLASVSTPFLSGLGGKKPKPLLDQSPGKIRFA